MDEVVPKRKVGQSEFINCIVAFIIKNAPRDDDDDDAIEQQCDCRALDREAQIQGQVISTLLSETRRR